MSIDGTILPFDVGALSSSASAINNLNQCVGNYSYDRSGNTHGFFRDTDGTLTFPIDAPGAKSTHLYGINDHRVMVWNYFLGAGPLHALLFQSLKKSVAFDYPGAAGTGFTGINEHGLICGVYLDAAGMNHGFVARVSFTSSN